MNALTQTQRERIYEAGAQALIKARGDKSGSYGFEARKPEYRKEAAALYAAMHAMTIVENNIKRELVLATLDDLVTDQS